MERFRAGKFIKGIKPGKANPETEAVMLRQTFGFGFAARKTNSISYRNSATVNK